MRNRLDATGYDTDKSALYLKNYEEHFQRLVDKDIRLLELGVDKGGSLVLWRDFFARGVIVGLDIRPCEIHDPSNRIRCYQGLQQDCALLDRIRRETAPNGFDVIIDDASHIGEFTRISFWHLFDNHLKPGGLYAIEDWRVGYWDSWIDGTQYKPMSHRRGSLKKLTDGLLRRKRQFPSHSYGMVGVIKELVDELGMDMITNPARKGVGPQKYSKFRKMEITPGQVFIVKANEKDLELLTSVMPQK